jgi:hypothetical protein
MANNTSTQAAQQTETTGVIDQGLGPIIDFWNSLPIYGKVLLAALAGIGFLLFYWIQNREEETKLEATDWSEKWENMLKAPTEKNGAKQSTLLFKQSNSASKRTIGKIVKLEETKTSIGKEQLEEAFNDSDKWDEIKDDVDDQTRSVTYSVVRGRKKFGRIVNTVLYKLAAIFSNGSNPQAEYFDIPVNDIEVTDRGVMIEPDVHLFKKDGLWQTTGQESQQRLQQLSWLSTHQNWTESLQKQPEFYSDLNMNISGVKNIENTKSKNMREYKQQEKLSEKGEAMEE